MTLKQRLGAVLQQEGLNFLLTNRIPRAALTRFMGWFSRIEHPIVRKPSLWAFRLFADDLGLDDAKKSEFTSLHDCFVRELKPGARILCEDVDVLVSPCDAIVGACGRVREGELIQAKGIRYALGDLLRDTELASLYRDGRFVTLRLKANMYHRFHAPHAGRVESLTYVSGDVWNVNPIALRRVPGLFTKNERAIIRMRLAGSGDLITLVPVAAVLVASMRFTFTDVHLHLRYSGPVAMPVDANVRKGDEMGHFEQGSTIIVFTPAGFELASGVEDGCPIRMGAPLMRRAVSPVPD